MKKIDPYPSGDHIFSGFAPRQETRKTGHLPHLVEHPGGGVGERETDIAADIKYAHFDRSDIALGALEQFRHLFLFTRVGGHAVAHPTG